MGRKHAFRSLQHQSSWRFFSTHARAKPWSRIFNSRGRYYSVKITSKGWSVVLGLAMGGILGNLVDRIFREPGVLRGHVIDWLQVPNFPVFNIADSAIVIAAGISMLLSMRNIPPITRVKSDS